LICDVDIIIRVNGEAARVVQRRVDSRTTVPRETSDAIAGKSADGPAGRNFADTPIARVGNVQITDGVARNGPREKKRIDGLPPAAAITLGSRAPDSADETVWRHFANTGIPFIHNIHVADGVDSDSFGSKQLGINGQTAVSRVTRTAVASD